MNRRTWIKTGAMAFAGTVARAGETAARPLFDAMGIAASLGDAARLKAAGASFLTLSTGSFLVPEKGEEVFEKQLEAVKISPLPVWACNSFIRPQHLRCVGPEANHQEVLAWADVVFRRLAKAGGRFVVFGSSGARRVPDGWPRGKAVNQFVDLLRKMGPLAEAHGVTVTVEQLRKQECNFLNRIGETADVVRKVSHPRIRVLADLYHMRVMGDSPDDLNRALDTVVHMEIAEKEDRTYPGVRGDDFRPFFQVLHDARWTGAISIEGRGSPDQVAAAFRTIAEQSTFT